jgi:phi13 family phage major tail protein
MQANINPNASNEALFADDGPMDTAASLGLIALELMAADLPLEVQAVLLGHTLDANTGIMSRKAGDVPPWVALGFKSLKSNGAYRFVWMTKGKFSVPEQKHETKGDKVTFQAPTINGSFVKRTFDDLWQLTADEDAQGYVAATGTNWFTAATINNPVV